MLTLAVDHLVVAAPTLEAGVAWVEERLGVPVGPGGEHPGAGTHNRLLRLGDCYLEVIARNPADTPTRPRWFGLDAPEWAPDAMTEPRLVTWALRTNDLDEALRLPGAKGRAVDASRGALVWRIGGTTDGSMAYGGAYPTFIEWPDGVGAVVRLPDSGCTLRALEIAHPDAAEIERALHEALRDARVTFHIAAPALKAIIAGRDGRRSELAGSL